jgi:predicted flap endonuclease-1-like 5' DNA nuclease
MMGDLQSDWLLLGAGLLVVLAVIAWLLMANRKTRIELQPGEQGDGTVRRNQSLIDAPAAALKDVAIPDPSLSVALAEAAEVVAAAPTPPPAPAATGDDLGLIKGLGPKLKAQLADMGITTFAQIAAWDDADIDRVDAQLGRFAGRIRRDSWVEQAKLLASGDSAGFASRFGNG